MRNFDYSKITNISVDSEIINLLTQIYEFKGKQELLVAKKQDSLEKLVEIAKIQSVETSNKIEGIVTTDTRIKQLLQNKTTPKNRDEKEIMGYRDVLNLIHESYDYIPITPPYILQLHKMLYKYSDMSFGGKFKNSQNYIVRNYPDGKTEILFTPPDAFETPEAVQNLCNEFNKAIGKAEIEKLFLIITFIKDFLCIHPFNDGNGRMSRLLTTLLLYRSNFFVGKYISLEKKIEETKEYYYSALQESSENWNTSKNDNTPFVKYMLKIILAAYREMDERLSLFEEKLPSREAVEKAVQKIVGKFTKQQVMELCPSLSKASVENALKSLCQSGKIERHGSGKATFYTRT